VYAQFSICASPGNNSACPFTSNNRMTLVLFIASSMILTMLNNPSPRMARSRGMNQRAYSGGRRVDSVFAFGKRREPPAAIRRALAACSIQKSTASLERSFFTSDDCLSVGGPSTVTFTPGSSDSSPEMLL
jgi:hypothetical protein